MKEGEISTMEERQINEWKTVSQEKASRSLKSQGLQSSQVTIATPSRFAALSNLGENGEKIEQEEGEILEDIGSEYEEDTMVIEVVNGKITVGENKDVRLTLPRHSKTNRKVIVDTSIQKRRQI